MRKDFNYLWYLKVKKKMGNVNEYLSIIKKTALTCYVKASDTPCRQWALSRCSWTQQRSEMTKKSMHKKYSQTAFNRSFFSRILTNITLELTYHCELWTGDHFVNAPSQWRTMLHCNVVSHWLGAYTKWSLAMECPLWVHSPTYILHLSLSNWMEYCIMMKFTLTNLSKISKS